MNRKYITASQVNRAMRKPLEQQTCKERRSSFLYYWLLDDFGERLRDLPWFTSSETLAKYGDRVAKVRLQVSSTTNEECLF